MLLWGLLAVARGFYGGDTLYQPGDDASVLPVGSALRLKLVAQGLDRLVLCGEEGARRVGLSVGSSDRNVGSRVRLVVESIVRTFWSRVGLVHEDVDGTVYPCTREGAALHPQSLFCRGEG